MKVFGPYYFETDYWGEKVTSCWCANPDTLHIVGKDADIIRDDEGDAEEIDYNFYYRDSNARPFILFSLYDYHRRETCYDIILAGNGDGHDVVYEIANEEISAYYDRSNILQARYWIADNGKKILTFWRLVGKSEDEIKETVTTAMELLKEKYGVDLFDADVAFENKQGQIIIQDINEFLGRQSSSYFEKVNAAFKQKHGGFEPFEYHQVMYQEDKKSNKPNINEGVTDIVYHFTDGYRGIINQNCFYFRADDTFDGRHPEGFDFCLSVTRCKNDKEGYSLKYSTQMETDGHITSYARFTLDGRLLNMNPNLKGQPFNFFYSRNLNRSDSPSPKQHYHNFLADPEASQHDNYPTYGYGIYDYDFDPDTGEMKSMDSEPDKTPEAAAFRVQNEDRIFSRIQRLDNANNYVKRIDIFVGTENQSNIIQQLMRTPNIQLYKDKIFIYKDNNEFNKQSNNCFALSRLSENKMKFDMNDIKYMVNEVIKRIRK